VVAAAGAGGAIACCAIVSSAAFILFSSSGFDHENPHDSVSAGRSSEMPAIWFMSGGSPNNAVGLSSFDWSTGACVSQMRAIRIDRRLRAGHLSRCIGPPVKRWPIRVGVRLARR